jgi:hypothetical protein
MPSLTHAEKQYWTARLKQRIDQNIESLIACEPSLGERLSALARQQAVHSLGLDDLHSQLDALAAQRQELKRRRRQTLQAMLAVLRRLPPDAVADVQPDAALAEIRQAIDKRQAVHEEELLAQQERGQHILRLRRERESLPDTIALAGAPAGLRQTWVKLLQVLGEEPTTLQQATLALAAEPSDP